VIFKSIALTKLDLPVPAFTFQSGDIQINQIV